MKREVMGGGEGGGGALRKTDETRRDRDGMRRSDYHQRITGTAALSFFLPLFLSLSLK